MMQLAVQTVSSLWPRIGALGSLPTPSGFSAFAIANVTADHVELSVGTRNMVLSKAAFDSALIYLQLHGHYAVNPCAIKSNNDPKAAGPLCLATRVHLSGTYGPRNVTYVLPILQALGVVEINTKRPATVWLIGAQAAATEALDPLPDTPLADDFIGALLTPGQMAFANYLSVLWTGTAGLFSHRYKVSKHHAWKSWKARNLGGEWWCQTLAQAAEHYSWPEKPAPHDFASIAAKLRAALAINDNVAARNACLAIFEWGGVARKADDASLLWINAQCEKGTLCGSILNAVKLLRPQSNQSLGEFDGKKLLMNSAMTKIYAAAAPGDIIIYDGRVGAALGLLVRRWLLANGQCAVPVDLAFRWGPNHKTKTNKTETRNPSQEEFIYVDLYTVSEKSAVRNAAWAELVRLSNRILQQTRALLACDGHDVQPAALERALFMVGYDVR
jgi:hypothetical protein